MSPISYGMRSKTRSFTPFALQILQSSYIILIMIHFVLFQTAIVESVSIVNMYTALYEDREKSVAQVLEDPVFKSLNV
jgi:hypothetical protein